MTNQIAAAFQKLDAHARSLKAGSFLFHAGDAVHHLYFVQTGEIHLLRHQPDGTALVLQRARTAAPVAEASLYSDRYHCDAKAVLATTLLAVDKRAFHRALAGDAQMADAWSRHLAREVQATRTRAEILALRTVAQRLDAWLAGHGGVMPDKGGWKALAEEIGVSPEALYREIARRR